MVADELPAGKPPTLFIGKLPRPTHEFGSHPYRIGMAIDSPLRKHIPNGDEQFSSDRDDRLGFRHAPGEAIKLGFPVREIANGTPGSLNKRPT